MKPFGLKLKYSNIKLNAFLFYDDRFTKTEIIVNGDKVYINFRCLIMPENGVKCVFFTIIFIDSSRVFENNFYKYI